MVLDAVIMESTLNIIGLFIYIILIYNDFQKFWVSKIKEET